MAGDDSTLHHHRTVFDGWRSVTISLYMTLTGYAVLVGVPVISTAWVNLLGFTEVEVGRVAGADLGGLSLGALFTAATISRFDRRWLSGLSALIAIAANALCMVMLEYDQVLWLRLLAGFGSGVYTAVAVANLGATAVRHVPRAPGRAVSRRRLGLYAERLAVPGGRPRSTPCPRTAT